MDGRSMTMASVSTCPAPVAMELEVTQQLPTITTMSSSLPKDTASDCEDGADHDLDMVLPKDDFLMLQAFHRFVPLPALSSRIVRLLCEDDLQVADNDDELPESSTAARRCSIGESTASTPLSQLVSGLKAVRTLSRSSVATQLSLTRRGSTNASQSKLKPHRQVNLAAHTPRIKHIQSSIDAEERRG